MQHCAQRCSQIETKALANSGDGDGPALNILLLSTAADTGTWVASHEYVGMCAGQVLGPTGEDMSSCLAPLASSSDNRGHCPGCPSLNAQFSFGRQKASSSESRALPAVPRAQKAFTQQDTCQMLEEN